MALATIMTWMSLAVIALVGGGSRRHVSVDSEISGIFGNEKMKTESVNHTFKQVKFMKHSCVCWSGRTRVIWR